MKLLLSILLLCSFGAYSQDYELDRPEITLNTNSLELLKPENGPNFVVLNVPVPTTQKFCVRYDERQIFGQNGSQCGYDLVERRDCSASIGYPGRGGVVVVRRGRGGVVTRPMPAPMPRPMPCRIYTERVPRSCYFMETFCSEYQTEVKDVFKKFNLEFKNFKKAAVINFSLDEYSNLVLDVTSEPASCVKKTIYGKTNNITGVKLKLKNSCR